MRNICWLLCLLLVLWLAAGCAWLGHPAATGKTSGNTAGLPTISATAGIPATSGPTSLTTKPTPKPTVKPTVKPTAKPTAKPTVEPTARPTARPTAGPTTEAPPEKVVLTGDERFYYTRLDSALRAKITGMSYPAPGEDCVITYDDLRDIRLLHYDFEGVVHEGELMVNARLADEVMEIFYQLYLAKYPLTSVHLVDDYGQPHIDGLSMTANNTSGFCYRYVTGTRTLSRHSYGAAIDVNPMLNPYINGDRVSPENGRPYVDRSLDFAGKIDHDDLCYRLFIAHGWNWGGDWSGDKDYQHFSKTLDQ